MRICFFGTPEFAVPSLRMLINEGHDVAGVFTQPDRPKGRSKKPVPPPTYKSTSGVSRYTSGTSFENTSIFSVVDEAYRRTSEKTRDYFCILTR